MDDSEETRAKRMRFLAFMERLRAVRREFPNSSLIHELQIIRSEKVRRTTPSDGDGFDPIQKPGPRPSSRAKKDGLGEGTPDRTAHDTSTSESVPHEPGKRWTDEQRRQLLLEVESHPDFGKYRRKKRAITDAAKRLGCSESLVRQQLAMAREARKKSGADG
ncbi:hypothetical protein [Ideonella sp. B508-1]|uniref:hypothetical protein n=1 Tax=Ideonella sp. B508-1 TaxID=137716 RepID=UPI0011D22B12|nr:hypothetical protein [Ideonella sp. B508-1]